MIPYFPTPYPDELLYSVIARYSEHCNKSTSKTTSDLFQSNAERVNFYCPKKVNVLFENIRSTIRIDQEKLIAKHTLQPFVVAFASPRRREVIRQYMEGYNNDFTFAKTDGMHAYSFKYCPLCSTVDRQDLGETYWRRSHNIPFVLSCTIHKCDLVQPALSNREMRDGNILSAEASLFRITDVTKNFPLKNFDQRCIDILNGAKPMDTQEIYRRSLEFGCAKKLTSRVVINRNFIQDVRRYVDQNYPYLHHLSPLLAHQIPRIINGNWGGVFPMIILVLEDFLRELELQSKKTLKQ